MSGPWLSVIVPTYNGDQYVASALDSILAQADEGIEVIVVDDGSTDETVKILERYRNRFGITVVLRSHTGNWLMTTNHGLSIAGGRFACVLHQDDLWLPGRFDQVRWRLRASPDSNLLIHPSWFIDDRGSRLGLWRCPLKDSFPDPKAFVKRLLIQNFVALPSVVFSRDLALSLGAFDEGLWYTADWDLWLRLAAQGGITYLAEPLTAFRIHSCSQTWLNCAQTDEFRRQMQTVYDRYLSGRETDWRNDARLRRVAQFSIEANTRLAARAHGRPADLTGLALSFLTLGPLGWHDYLKNSRILERSFARIRLKKGNPPCHR